MYLSGAAMQNTDNTKAKAGQSDGQRKAGREGQLLRVYRPTERTTPQ